MPALRWHLARSLFARFEGVRAHLIFLFPHSSGARDRLGRRRHALLDHLATLPLIYRDAELQRNVRRTACATADTSDFLIKCS